MAKSIGASASASVLPMNTQDWSPLGWTGWISLQSKGLSTPQFKSINSSAFSFLYRPTLTSIHDTGKTIALTRWTFVGKVMSLLLNMLSRLVITFLPRSKRLLILWLQSPSGHHFGAQKNKVSHCFYCFPIYFPRNRLISSSSYSGLFHLQSSYIFWLKWRHNGE